MITDFSSASMKFTGPVSSDSFSGFLGPVNPGSYDVGDRQTSFDVDFDDPKSIQQMENFRRMFPELYEELYSQRVDELNRQYNSSEAQKARDFEERMSNTSYQRAVEDMRKAGLNPLLAFQQGGSSTPSGSSASYSPVASTSSYRSSESSKNRGIALFSSLLSFLGKIFGGLFNG